jgi:hypothetical protein
MTRGKLSSLLQASSEGSPSKVIEPSILLSLTGSSAANENILADPSSEQRMYRRRCLCEVWFFPYLCNGKIFNCRQRQ